MASLKQDTSAADILQELTDQAKAVWGEQRAAQLKAQLEQTAANLWQIRNAPLQPAVEPGFYQFR